MRALANILLAGAGYVVLVYGIEYLQEKTALGKDYPELFQLIDFLTSSTGRAFGIVLLASLVFFPTLRWGMAAAVSGGVGFYCLISMKRPDLSSFEATAVSRVKLISAIMCFAIAAWIVRYATR